jgi:hypothetical protein
VLVTVLGKRWQFVRKYLRGTADGYCEPPDTPGKQIVVHSALRGERELEVIIHELLHAGSWHLDESVVKEWAKDIARILTRDGWRRDAEAAED